MVAQTFIDRDVATGLNTQKRAADVSTGASDAGRVVALNANGEIDSSMLPEVGSVAVVAAGDLDAWDVVEIFDNAGTPNARKASAAAGTPRPGQAFTKTAILDAATGKVYFDGTLAGQTGLTAGQRVYLSDTTPGHITTTPVSGTGKLHQFLGRAISATEVEFEEDDVVVLA